jgi:hypothetical protein
MLKYVLNQMKYPIFDANYKITPFPDVQQK